MARGHWQAAAIVAAAALLVAVALPHTTSACSRVNVTPAVGAGDIAKVLGSAADATVLSTDPFILLFEQFATPSEVEQLVDTMTTQQQRQFEKSTMGPSASKAALRSSRSIYCDTPLCYKAPIVHSLMDRIGRITRTPEANAEFLQLLRYDVGEQYRIHHDFIGGGDVGGAGGRVYSLVLFLSDTEEGGELHFADVNITIKPRIGSAVLWPTLMSEDLSLPEMMTHHASLPVTRGQKLAAVTWVRQHDWRTLAVERKCRVDGAATLEPPLVMLAKYMKAREAAGLEPKAPVSLIAKLQAEKDYKDSSMQGAGTNRTMRG